MAFNADYTRLVTASWDRTLRIWDIDENNYCKRFEGHQSVEFSADGKRMMTSVDEGVVKVYDLISGGMVGDVVDLADSVNHAIFTPDGRYAILASRAGLIGIWNIKTGT